MQVSWLMDHCFIPPSQRMSVDGPKARNETTNYSGGTAQDSDLLPSQPRILRYGEHEINI